MWPSRSGVEVYLAVMLTTTCLGFRMCGAKVEAPPVVVVPAVVPPPCAIDTEEFLQGGLGEGQVLKRKRAARDEEAEWKLQRRTEAAGCRLTSFMMCRRGSRPKSVRQDTGRRILSIRWKTHIPYS
jgi:hypothetical protein